jgi:hypothetical protein
MEPFFIFCAALSTYCGYLTCIDLLSDMSKKTSINPLEKHPAESVGKMIQAGCRRSWDRLRTSADAEPFPRFLRATL